MKLLKTTLLSGVITFVRIASGLVGSKAIAVFTGPSGVAIIGAFTNFLAIVLTFGNGAINTGVVKYTAEYADDEQSLKVLFSTALRISVICSVFFGVVLLLFAPSLADWILTSSLYVNPIRVLGITLILYSMNNIIISILNGKGEIKKFTIVNSVGSIIGLLFTIILVYYFKVLGALYALVLSQSIIFFVSAGIMLKADWFSWSYFNRKLDVVFAKKLSHFSFMAIISALTLPVSQIFLRNIIISKLGIDQAGFWQGMMRISDGYLLLVTTALGTYYLPILSSLKRDEDIKKEIFRGYRLIMPMVLIGCIIIYILRFFIIKTLYTTKFEIMEELFFWQLLGDFFKIAAMFLAYLMVAKAMTKLYIITEVLFSLGYVVIGMTMIHYYGLKGISVAFSINYLIYFIMMLFLFRKILFK